MRKLFFVTTGCLASNPRLYKEVTYLSDKAECTLLCFRPVSWQVNFEQDLELEAGKVTIERLESRSGASLAGIYSFLICKAANFLLPLFKKNIFLASMATDRRSLVLNQKLKLMDGRKFECVIAHNPGTLFPVHKYAKRNAVPFVFDMEDWHPGEYVSRRKKLSIEVKLNLLSKILPDATAVTLASPLFEEKLKAISPQEFRETKTVYIANSFPRAEFMPVAGQDLNGPLKMVWFSQNITGGRGLEFFLPVLERYAGDIELTLIGQIQENSNWHKRLSSMRFIRILKPMSPKQLNRFIGHFDVGIAADFPGRDENRDISISNKIISYLQAGLFVLASETRGHRWILSDYKSHGILTSTEVKSIVKAMDEILSSKNLIRENKLKRLEAAKDLSWENECRKLDNIYL